MRTARQKLSYINLLFFSTKKGLFFPLRQTGAISGKPSFISSVEPAVGFEPRTKIAVQFFTGQADDLFTPPI